MKRREKVIEEEVEEQDQELEATAGAEEESAEQASDEQAEGAKDGRGTAEGSLREAWRQVFGQALSVALQGRGNVVMVRVNDEALRYLDMLVEAEITKSRSESAAFLINEGINANDGLFDRIKEITQQIADLRTQLREQVQHEVSGK
jgi:hypothetical protein